MTIERALELLPQMRDSEWITVVGQKTALYTDEAKEAFNLAISALEKQEADRWIPVTERLPEEDDYKPCYGYDDGAVWWLNDIGMMGLGWYYTSTENWAFYDEITHVEGIVGNVIAWRPLPEPYTEEEA